MQIRLEFKLADLWIGAFWQRRIDGLHIWICFLPCLPIHIFLTDKSELRRFCEELVDHETDE